MSELRAQRLPLTSADPVSIGAYRLMARLGQGGMGVVYLAQTPGGLEVAIKTMRRPDASNAVSRARFTREMTAQQELNLAGIARVLGGDIDAFPPYVVFEFLDGPTLEHEVLERGPLERARLRALLLGLAETLSEMNLRGYDHRDLKPGNVVLAPGGPRLIDFGVVRGSGDGHLTSGGFTVGTPDWLTPEHVRGQPLTAATDIYNLGAVLVFAATGEGPFGRGEPEVLWTRMATQQPRLGALEGELRQLVGQMLASDPRDRPSARQIMTILSPAQIVIPPAATGTLDRLVAAPMSSSSSTYPAQAVSVRGPAGVAHLVPSGAGIRLGRKRGTLAGCAAAVAVGSVAWFTVHSHVLEPPGAATASARTGSSSRSSGPIGGTKAAETVGLDSHTWSDYTHAAGSPGAVIEAQHTVYISCRITGFRVEDGNTWWYRIASAPWNDDFYVSADAFYNNGSTSGSLHGTPFVDPSVPSC